ESAGRRFIGGADAPQLIGVGKSFGSPRPPNRTGDFLAYGSPVGGFLIGNRSRQARPYKARTALLARSGDWASVDDRRDRGRSRGAFPACAELRAAVCG